MRLSGVLLGPAPAPGMGVGLAEFPKARPRGNVGQNVAVARLSPEKGHLGAHGGGDDLGPHVGRWAPAQPLAHLAGPAGGRSVWLMPGSSFSPGRIGGSGCDPSQLQYKVKFRGQDQLAVACSDRPGKNPDCQLSGTG